MATLVKTATFSVPLRFLFSLHADPRRWPEWVEGMREITGIEGDHGTGTIVGTKTHALGMTQPWTCTIGDCACDDDQGFWEGELKGMLASVRERWTFKADGGQTRVEWQFDYHAKGGPLGHLVERLLLDKAMDEFMAGSLKNLQQLSTREFAP